MNELFYSRLEQNFVKLLDGKKAPDKIGEIVRLLREAISMTANGYYIDAVAESMQNAGVRSVGKAGRSKLMTGTTGIERAEVLARMCGVSTSSEFDKFFSDLQKAVAPLPGLFLEIPTKKILAAIAPYGWRVADENR